MPSICVNTGNWALEWVSEKYTRQTMFSKNYKLFLSK